MSAMSERPRLHLDFAAPSTPPPTYSPYTYQNTSPTFSPTSPTKSTDSPVTATSPKTPASQRIIMGVMVSTPLGEEEDEKTFSLEVPGIVLTEPPHPPSPRIPSPPPKQVVLLAPTSLPLPPSPLLSEKSLANGYFSRPSTIITFIQNRPTPPAERQRAVNLRTTILVMFLVLGAWHLWSTLQLGSLVEDALDVL